jgi:maleylpyruvate isomerase
VTAATELPEHPSPADVPDLLRVVEAAQDRLEAAVRAAGDLRPEAPTTLPGWTVGHVLTHLARHADATSRVVVGAAVGERPEQYVGGAAGRVEEIERGAGRVADALLADLRTSHARCALVLRHVPSATWAAELVRPGGPEPVTRALVSRWREVEIHAVDLGLVRPADWPDEFVAHHLPRELRRLGTRAPGVRVPAGLPDHEVLAWLVGRGDRRLPALPAWA